MLDPFGLPVETLDWFQGPFSWRTWRVTELSRRFLSALRVSLVSTSVSTPRMQGCSVLVRCSVNHNAMHPCFNQSVFLPLDIDQCLTNNGGCEQVCINLAPGFECACFQGYVLDSNGTTCSGVWPLVHGEWHFFKLKHVIFQELKIPWLSRVRQPIAIAAPCRFSIQICSKGVHL